MNLHPYFILAALAVCLTGGYLIFEDNHERNPAGSEETVRNQIVTTPPLGGEQPHQARKSSPYPTASYSPPGSEKQVPPPVAENDSASHASGLSENAPSSAQEQSAGYTKTLWHEAPVPKAARQQPPLEHTEYIAADPGAIQGLMEGDPVEIYIPQTARSYSGMVVSETRHFGKVRVLEVDLDYGDESNNMTITSGQRQTFIALNTPDGIYDIRLDNQSGNGTVVNEMEYRSRQSGVDSIPAPNTPVPEQPPFVQ